MGVDRILKQVPLTLTAESFVGYRFHAWYNTGTAQSALSHSARVSKPAPRIIAAGGGSAEDERPLLELFADWTGSEGKVLFLPVAQAGMGRPLEGCLAWGKAALQPVGITDITMWADLNAENHLLLADFDSIFISGGNTFFCLTRYGSFFA